MFSFFPFKLRNSPPEFFHLYGRDEKGNISYAYSSYIFKEMKLNQTELGGSIYVRYYMCSYLSS